MDNDIIVVNKGTILALINYVRKFCDITDIKGFDSMNIILGVEMSLEEILKSATTASKPKETADLPKNAAE